MRAILRWLRLCWMIRPFRRQQRSDAEVAGDLMRAIGSTNWRDGIVWAQPDSEACL